MSDLIVKASNLTKNYGAFTALNGVSFGLEKGKIIGLLGPNGSGKTTLIKILAGLLTASGGDVSIDGKKIGYETKAIVSYLPERTYFNSWMTVNQCLDYFCDFYADFDRALAEKMLASLGVTTNAKLKTMSKGTKEKVQLILVMARRAKLYLLDEPIAGVDPAARDYILETIIQGRSPDSTVIISTHLISDIEGVLDEYAFVKQGVIVEGGNVSELKEKTQKTLDEHFREVFKYVL